jgi:hypothetical protein
MADYRHAQLADPQVRNRLVRSCRPGPTSRLFIQLPPQKVTQAAIGAGMARVEKTQAVKMITPGSRVISIMGLHITRFDSRSRPWISLMLHAERQHIWRSRYFDQSIGCTEPWPFSGSPLIDVLPDLGDHYGAFAHRRGYPLDRPSPHVPDSKNAGVGRRKRRSR